MCTLDRLGETAKYCFLLSELEVGQLAPKTLISFFLSPFTSFNISHLLLLSELLPLLFCVIVPMEGVTAAQCPKTHLIV